MSASDCPRAPLGTSRVFLIFWHFCIFGVYESQIGIYKSMIYSIGLCDKLAEGQTLMVLMLLPPC